MQQEELIINIFPLLSDTISHYQYLGIVMITAAAVLLMVSIKKKYCIAIVLSIITIIILIIFLILGIFAYREIINQYYYLLDLNGMAKQKLSLINQYILCQSWIGIIALISLVITFFCYAVNSFKGKDK